MASFLRNLVSRKRRVCVVGLDCAEPRLVFGRYQGDLPNLTRLAAAGTCGTLETTIPPITIPAWAALFSNRDPGELGCYGFRNRADYSYNRQNLANANMLSEPQVWDYASDAGKRVITVGIPHTYPVKPVNGIMVSGFLAPDTNSEFTYPSALKGEIAAVASHYLLDVHEFRTDDKDKLLSQIYDMTGDHFKLIKHLLVNKEWDLFMSVEIGVDRIHHAFWKYCDPEHPKYEPGNKYQHAIHDYYRFIDAHIGEILALLPANTQVMVLSDHGAQAMVGGFCFNEWLIREGYLVLKQQPASIARLNQCEVDWSRTTAWGDGGYYGRLMINVVGREPQGTVPAERYEDVISELTARLEATVDHQGQPLGTRVFRPQLIYRTTRNIPPDLVVYFGNLSWRSVGSVGHHSVYTFENDTGPDDANHAQNGMYILSGRDVPMNAQPQHHTWKAIAPTILDGLGIPVPGWMNTERISY